MIGTWLLTNGDILGLEVRAVTERRTVWDFATAALRQQSPSVLREGLIWLLRASDGKDPRDLMLGLAPFHDCARRLGLDVSQVGMTAIEFPQRLTALILGGTELTRPRPTDIPPSVDALSRGDWAAFWPLYGMPLAPEVTLNFERNDPKAMAAANKGRIEFAYVFDLGRVSVPTLVYRGGDDDPDDAVPTAQALKTELHVVEGCDHFGAFKAVDSVMPFAVPFLKTAASG